MLLIRSSFCWVSCLISTALVVRGILIGMRQLNTNRIKYYQTKPTGISFSPRRARSVGGKTSQEGQMPLPSAAA